MVFRLSDAGSPRTFFRLSQRWAEWGEPPDESGFNDRLSERNGRRVKQRNGSTLGHLLRRGTLCVIAGACLGFGGLLLWAWLDPVTLGASQPLHLLMLLGLFLLPSSTMAFLSLDQREPETPADDARPVAGVPEFEDRVRHASTTRRRRHACVRRARVARRIR